MKKEYRELRKWRTKCLTLCGIFTALGVVVMYLGSFIEVLDLTVAVIASMLCIVGVIEMGGAWPWLIYASTSVLSFILLPNKFPAAVYLFFAGFYPMIKEKIEGRVKNKSIRIIIKLVLFNIAFFAMIFAALYIFMMPKESEIMMAALVILGNVTFVVYDIALTRIIIFYMVKLRPRFRFFIKK